jgi:alcohol dehydrogenase
MATAPRAEWVVAEVGPNPNLEALADLSAQLRPLGVEAAVGLGGGSALDSAKALAASLHPANAWSLPDLLASGSSQPPFEALPLAAIPTTAGTGSEATPFATVWDPPNRRKLSLASPSLFPEAAFLVPGLTLSLPPLETLLGAMDAVSHALETLWNVHSTPVSRCLAREAAAAVARSLPLVQARPGDLEGRSALQAAAAMAGMAISQNRTALAHSISYPLTLHHGVPHGLAASFSLPALAGLVEEAGAWPGEEDRQAAWAAVELVRRQGLPDLLLRHCGLDDVLALAGEMIHPERGGNFVLPPQGLDLAAIIRKSLA